MPTILFNKQDFADSSSYVCFSPQRSGIGSQIHVLGLVLAVAMDLDRVLLLDTDVHDALFTDDEYCGAFRNSLADLHNAHFRERTHSGGTANGL